MIRKSSFISIEVESMELIEHRKNKIEQAKLIINQNKQFTNYFILFFYFKWICHYFYEKSFYIKNMCFKTTDRYTPFYKLTQLVIKDHLIIIHGSEIPYEHIISFNIMKECLCLRVFAKMKVGKRLYFEPCEEIMHIMLCFQSPEICKQVSTIITRCMYYHIKYNKINENVVDYYIKLEKEE